MTIGTGVDMGSWTEANLTALQKAGVSKDTLDKLRPLIGKKREEACKALRAAKASGPLVLPQSDIELIDQQAMTSRVPGLEKSFDDAADDLGNSYQAQIDDELNKPDQKKIQKLQAQIDKEDRKRPPNQAKIQSWQAQIDAEKAKKPDQAKIKQLQAKINSLKHFGDLKCSDQTILMSTYYHEGRITAKHMQPYVKALVEGDSDAAKAALTAKTKDKNSLIAGRGAQELKLFESSSAAAQGGLQGHQ